MLRRIGAPLVALTLALFLPAAALADVLEEVRERGSLRIGVSAFVPWTFRNTDGALEGFEIDLGQRIAQDIGVEVEFVEVPFAEIMAQLNAGDIDMIAAGMAITPERALEINFTRPYFESGVTLATNTAATAGIDSLQAVNAAEVSIAVVEGTLAAGLAARLFDQATVVTFPDSEAARAAVLSGDAPIYLASVPEATFFSLTHPGEIDLPTGEPLVRSAAGFGVKKGEHDWRAFLDAWIVARTADLFIPTVHSVWFESIDWADRVAAEAPAE